MSNIFVHYSTISNPDKISNIVDQFKSNSRVKVDDIIVNRSKAAKLFCRKGLYCTTCETNANTAKIVLDTTSNTYSIRFYCPNDIILTMDHIIPKSLGGGDNLSNLIPMCLKCNQTKGNNLNIDFTTPNLLLYVSHIKVLINIFKVNSKYKFNDKQLKQLKYDVSQSLKSNNKHFNLALYKIAFAISLYELKNNVLISSLNQSKIYI